MKISVNENRYLELSRSAGTMNENNVGQLEIIVPEKYQNYNKKIVFLHEGQVIGWDFIEDNKYILTKSITKHERVSLYIWLTSGEDDFRSETKEIEFNENKDASDQITDEEMGRVNTVINLLEEEITKVTDLEKEVQALIDNIQFKLDNGEFDGQDYILTEEDKEEIVDTVKPRVETDIQPILENIENVAKQAEVIAKGASQALNYLDYQDMVTNFNAFDKNKFDTSKNIMIKKLNVPDVWICGISENYVNYEYTTDEDLVNLLLSDTGLQVGYYVLSPLETQKVDLTEYTKQDQFVTLTQAEYDALTEKSANTYYFIIEEE